MISGPGPRLAPGPSVVESDASAEAAGAEASTPFDVVLALESLDTAANPGLLLPETLAEELTAEGQEPDVDDSEDDAETGEDAEPLAFLATLLNVSPPAPRTHPGAATAGMPGMPPTEGAGAPVAQLGAEQDGSPAPNGRAAPTPGDAERDALATELPKTTNSEWQLATKELTHAMTGASADGSDSAERVTPSSRGGEWQPPGVRQAVPAGAASTMLNTPVRDPRWADDFSTRVALMVRGGDSFASLQLSPVELGPLDVNVSVRDGQASIHFGAAHAETRALIEASLPKLREMLAAQGFQLLDASVSQGFARQTKSEPVSSVQGVPDPEIEPVTPRISTLNGLLDLYA